MPLGPPPPAKGGVDDPPLDPAGLGNRTNDEVIEGHNMFNNQMGPMGQSVFFSTDLLPGLSLSALSIVSIFAIKSGCDFLIKGIVFFFLSGAI